MNPKTDIDKRVIEAIESIQSEKGVKTEKGISRLLGFHELFFNKVKKGMQSATVEAIEKIVTDYNISADWIFTGKGEMRKMKGVEFSEFRNKTIELGGQNTAYKSIAGIDKEDIREENNRLKKENDILRRERDLLKGMIVEMSRGKESSKTA